MTKQHKIRCTRKLHFSSGHRVMGHEDKCATPHGHNYDVLITAEAEKLDHVGRVIDFSVLKKRVGSWLEEHWDHTFLVYEKDTQLIKAMELMPKSKSPFICPFNPTAENIAHYLLHHVCPEQLLDTGVYVTKVVVYETHNCWAEATFNS